MSSAAVCIRGLKVAAAGHTILGPLDLELEQSEHVLLLGASGSGKTTLLRAIAGLVAPEAGTIELDGEFASAPGRVVMRPENRAIGMLFQGAALWPHMSVAKTLRFALRHGGSPDSAEAVAILLGQVQLAGMEARMPASLSGGEKQRLALARAIAGRPKLLLLDEPLGPLDTDLRGDLLRMLADLHSELHWTTIHVTHDPGEARSYASRVLRLTNGRMETEREQ